MDIECKNNHFINLNLADYGRMFGDNKLFDELDKLPKPDLIIASPPCESWSVASAMWGGNASWKQETGAVNRELSKFTVRGRADYDLPYAIYGKVLGKAKCKSKKLSEEEKDEYCTDLDYVLERPEIVDYPTDNGWIKCSERLPEPFDTSEELRNLSNRHLIYYTEDDVYWFIGLLVYRFWMVFIRRKGR